MFNSYLAGFPQLLGGEIDILERLDGADHRPDIRKTGRAEQLLG